MMNTFVETYRRCIMRTSNFINNERVAMNAKTNETRATSNLQNAPVANSRTDFGFIVATVAFLMAFAFSNFPVPLYATLQSLHPGITDAHVSLTMFTYLISVVLMLLFSGKLSEALGRKPLVIASMAIGAASCWLFLYVESAATLLFVRFLQGLSCGLAMAPISSYIIDLAGSKREVFARTIVGTFAMLGVAIGSVGIGVWNLISPDYAPAFYFAIVAQLGCAAAVLPCPETIAPDSKIPLRDVFKSPVNMPPSIRPLLPLAGIAYISAWSMGTYYQAFSALVATDTFGSTGTLLGAIILTLSMCPSVLGGPLEARLPKGVGLRVGMWLFLATTIGMCVFMWTQQLLPFLVALSLFSLSMGIALAGSLRILFAADPNVSSASIIPTINLIAYLGCSVFNIGMSALVNSMELMGALLVLSAVCIVCIFICLNMCRKAEASQSTQAELQQTA